MRARAPSHTRSEAVPSVVQSPFLCARFFRSGPAGRVLPRTQLRARGQRRRRLPRVDDDRRPVPLRVRRSPAHPLAHRCHSRRQADPLGRSLPRRTARRRVFVWPSPLPASRQQTSKPASKLAANKQARKQANKQASKHFGSELLNGLGCRRGGTAEEQRSGKPWPAPQPFEVAQPGPAQPSQRALTDARIRSLRYLRPALAAAPCPYGSAGHPIDSSVS